LFLSRRWSIWAACILCIVANVIMMTTDKIGGLYAGRLIIGLANGLFMTFAQLYLQVWLKEQKWNGGDYLLFYRKLHRQSIEALSLQPFKHGSHLVCLELFLVNIVCLINYYSRFPRWHSHR
jgi:Sugar (and other) transporter